MCRVKNFLCCMSLECGGIFLGYAHFLFGLSAFVAISVITMWILAKCSWKFLRKKNCDRKFFNFSRSSRRLLPSICGTAAHLLHVDHLLVVLNRWRQKCERGNFHIFFLFTFFFSFFYSPRTQQEPHKVCRFKFFSAFCLGLKIMALVGVLCAFYEVGVVRNKNFDDILFPVIGIVHAVSWHCHFMEDN